MQLPVPLALTRLIVCGALLAGAVPMARAQTGTLQLPAHRAAESPPKPPAAAPIAPVQQVKPLASPPVVAPHGPTHAQKPAAASPPAHAATQKPGAHKPPGKPAAPAAPVAAPKPESKPAEAPAQANPAPAGPEKGTSSGLPLPRFASLRSDDVNLRAGPGTRYPIEWVYKRRDLPVEIEREFEVWRLIKDPDGVRGWVHQATLTGRRSFLVEGGDAMLRSAPQETAAPVAELKPGVIGRIRSCDAKADWCKVQVGQYRGFLKRGQVWGVLPGETISP